MADLGHRAARHPWAVGITIFAGAMLIMSGGSQFFLGLAAVINNSVLVRVGRYLYAFDPTVWGWIHLLLGVTFVVVGWFIITGKSWALLTGIVLAMINGLLNFMWLPYYPIWAVILIAIDILVIWALATSRSTS